MNKVLSARLLAAIALTCGVIGCSAEGAEYGNGTGGSGGGGGGFATGGTGGGGGGPPPETELESTYGAPVATGHYVWIANPASGRVAYIDAATLEIHVVEAGNAPTVVAAVPDPEDDVAIVLNVLSHDATLFRAKGPSVTASSFEVPSSGNSFAISKDGHFAVAWTDSKRVVDPDPFDGFQDITVLDLTKSEAASTPLTVGYRPVAMGFDADVKRAFAVTQDGITVIALDGGAPSVVKNIQLGALPSGDAVEQDVAITPDGAYALLRREGDATVGVFSLDTGERTDVTLSGPVTDLDLSPSGDTAVCVVRDTSEVALLKVPEIVTDPAAITVVPIAGATIGSVSLPLESPLAFLYTNGVPSTILASVDTSDVAKAPSYYKLWAPIQSVFPTADAAHAVVLHGPMDGSQYPAAMSVLPIASGLPANLTGLDGPAVSVAVAPAGHRAIVAAGDETIPEYRLYVASMPSLEVTKIKLASQPISAGIVAGADRGYVAQKHPDGRITFVDFKTSEVRTLTGFELGSGVVDGSGE